MANLKAVDTQTGEIIGDVKQPDRARENHDFVMLYRRFLQQVADLGMKDAQALRVLLFIVKHMDFKNALAVPMNLISDMLGISRQTVSAKIKYLEKEGWIDVFKLGRANVYVVNPDVVWTSYADQKSSCKFEATMLLSSDDNWEILNRKEDQRTIKHIDYGVLKKLAEQEFSEPKNN